MVLWANMANLGATAGFMLSAGRADVLYGLILPHGMLELTIIFVAAGAGLRLGWSWIAPGRRTRSAALAAEGRAAGAIAPRLAGWLLVSGLMRASSPRPGYRPGSASQSGLRSGWPSSRTFSHSAGRPSGPGRPATWTSSTRVCRGNRPEAGGAAMPFDRLRARQRSAA